MKTTTILIISLAFIAGFAVGIKCTLYVEEHGHAPAIAKATPSPEPRVFVPTTRRVISL